MEEKKVSSKVTSEGNLRRYRAPPRDPFSSEIANNLIKSLGNSL